MNVRSPFAAVCLAASLCMGACGSATDLTEQDAGADASARPVHDAGADGGPPSPDAGLDASAVMEPDAGRHVSLDLRLSRCERDPSTGEPDCPLEPVEQIAPDGSVSGGWRELEPGWVELVLDRTDAGDPGIADTRVVGRVRLAVRASALSAGATIPVEGTTHVDVHGVSGGGVPPSTSWTGGPSAPDVRDAWIEVVCYCDQADGDQHVSGTLEITGADGARIQGRLTLDVEGIVAAFSPFAVVGRVEASFDLPAAR